MMSSPEPSEQPEQPLTLDEAMAIDSIAADAVRPEDARIALCPTHRATDAVDRKAAAHLFSALPVDRWVLPYDKGTEHELDLLRAVPADRDHDVGVRRGRDRRVACASRRRCRGHGRARRPVVRHRRGRIR